MPDDDSMIAQGTVDFRNEERRHRNTAYVCRDPEGDWIQDQQASICTQDDTCQAQADGHQPDCPVEQQLRTEFGF